MREKEMKGKLFDRLPAGKIQSENVGGKEKWLTRKTTFWFSPHRLCSHRQTRSRRESCSCSSKQPV